MSVSRDQRHTKSHRCPVCDGADGDPRGRGKRCSGFTTTDGYAHCSREDYSGNLTANNAGLYAHKLRGSCRCGVSHGADNVTQFRNVATYDYLDEFGKLRFQVVRMEPKTFRQRRPDGLGGWIWNMEGVDRIPYRLPDLINDDSDRPVYIVEGEKDADTLHELGLTATCNPGGAGKWSQVSAKARDVLAGREVIVVADADDVGRRHAADVAWSLEGVAARVRKCEPPPPHKDATDMIRAGLSIDALVFDEPADAGPLGNLPALAKVALLGRDSILAVAAKPPVFAWQDIAVMATICVIAGDPGGGKTTLLFLLIAARLNMGAPVSLLNRQVAPAPAGSFFVLIEGEHSEGSTARKLLKSMRVMGVDDRALERIIIVARKAVHIGSPEWKDVVSLVAAGKVSDIALDTLARVAPSDADNESEQVAVFNQIAVAIDACADETKRPMAWVVAHTKKSASGELTDVSGSTQRTGQADSVLLSKAERVGGRVVSCRVTFAKLREEPEDYPLPVDFTVTKTGVVYTEAPDALDQRPLEERILERLELGPKTKNKLREDLSRSSEDIDNALSNLFAARSIRTTHILVRGKQVRAFERTEQAK